jgi:type IV pilus assembly protein PilX
MSRRQSAAAQRGMVLVSSLLLLVVVTILAIGLFRAFGQDEKVAGNTREKQRALQAAISAEQYAEWWLINGNSTGTITCSGTVQASVGQICSNVLTTVIPNVALVPWTFPSGSTVQVTYPGPAGSTGWTVNNTTGITGSTYYSAPAFYISFLGVGTAPTGGTQGLVYQIDAVGYGGTPSTAAVVESTFILSVTTKDLTGI